MGTLARRIAALAGELLLVTATALAQNPPPRDSTRTRVDTIPFDSLTQPHRLSDSATARDTIMTDSLRPVLPALTPPGPVPRGGRWVFDDDALRYLGALDLGELLAHIPGVMIVRGGWYGQTSVLSYAGQGAASVEIYWDGYRLDPLGADSSAIDLGRISVGLARRVEVEVLPTVLRVYLVSDTQPVRRARTETSFATGDATTNTYRIRYLNRWRQGTGLGLGVNWFGTDGPGTSPGHVADLTMWAKGTWTPSPLVGVEFQLLSYSAKHDSLTPRLTGPAVPRANDTRRDLFVRGHVGSQPDGMGASFDMLLGNTTYKDSSGVQRAIAQAAAIAALRRASLATQLTLRVRDARTPVEVEGRAAWSPFGSFTLSGFARSAQHEGSRSSTEAGAVAGLAMGPLGVHGALRWRAAVARPDIVTDSAQRVSDVSAGVSFASRPLYLDVSVERHGRFEAPTWDVLRRSLPAQTAVDVATLTAAFRISPKRYLTLSGWYRNPLDPVHAAYEPPHHTNLTLTFRSRMLPRYRRGVFDLSLIASLEGWGDGVAGRDSSGNEIRLLGATAYNYMLEVRLVGAVLFWTLRNAGAERYALVPDFDQARAIQRFGVRWEFTN